MACLCPGTTNFRFHNASELVNRIFVYILLVFTELEKGIKFQLLITFILFLNEYTWHIVIICECIQRRFIIIAVWLTILTIISLPLFICQLMSVKIEGLLYCHVFIMLNVLFMYCRFKAVTEAEGFHTPINLF